MDYMKKKLTLQEALDYLEELSENDDDGDDIRTIFIEPPEYDGHISGEDDAEEDSGGIPDNVCPSQLKSNCEMVFRSGRRITNNGIEENTCEDTHVTNTLLDILDNNWHDSFIDEANLSPTLNEPKIHPQLKKIKPCVSSCAMPFPVKRNVEFTWENDDSSNMIPIFPESNYEDCRHLKPHEQFEKFWDDNLLKHIADQSAKYAIFREKNHPHITIAELRTFIGILLITGYNNSSSYKCMWSNDEDLKNTLVCDSMRRNRFQEILQCLHFEDSVHVGTNETPNPDKIWKLRPITDHLKSNMLRHFHPEQNLSYDESMIAYFGRHGCKQFIQGKPLRFGFKVWSLCTPSGYIVNFEIYQGKNPRSNTLYEEKFGKCSAPLINMIDDFSKDVQILPFSFYFDNLFTSFPLLAYLKIRGYNATGTIRENRIPLNCPIADKKKLKKEQRGFYKSTTMKETNIYLTKWVDNAVVSLASTSFGVNPLSNVARYSKVVKKKINITRPYVVKEYNKNMCGVDRLDQNVSLYRIGYRGKKWWSCIFTWLIDVCVQNAWQLHRNGQSKMSQLEFKRQIAIYYCKHYGEKPKTSGAITNRKRRIDDNSLETTLRYDKIDHLVIPILKKRRCAGDLCTTIGRTACKKCNVGLCVKCFAGYHEP